MMGMFSFCVRYWKYRTNNRSNENHFPVNKFWGLDLVWVLLQYWMAFSKNVWRHLDVQQNKQMKTIRVGRLNLSWPHTNILPLSWPRTCIGCVGLHFLAHLKYLVWGAIFENVFSPKSWQKISPNNYLNIHFVRGVINHSRFYSPVFILLDFR